MTIDFDLDAYLARIGYAGNRMPTLETLTALHRRHAETIPFENLNPLVRWPVRLDVMSLQQKLVRDGRGGYCYEQNLLFTHALRALGFEVTGLAARVRWNAPEAVVNPRSHMLLLIDLDDRPYIADVGFGGLVLTAPLRLEPDLEQATPHEVFRLVRTGPAFILQARIADAWMSLYVFDLQEQALIDYEVTNWYVSTHPQSHFVSRLTAARPDAGRRYALRDNDFAIHHVNGGTERRLLTTAAELRATLETVFRIAVPKAPEFDAALERLVPPVAAASPPHFLTS
jgi:N-hydroxyarylamine O-acetyltransferase